MFVAPVPDGTGRVFVGELAGRIRILPPGNGHDRADAVPRPARASSRPTANAGCWASRPAPDFASVGQFYVFVTDPVGTIEVRRYTR